jgi:hypothetical protein
MTAAMPPGAGALPGYTARPLTSVRASCLGLARRAGIAESRVALVVVGHR